ncbi:MAG: hypothetical protein F6K41_14190 [Symploca sp. SIO3E6]|nr:hypothetical protein [Caldora sp. SIO3E6]
MTLQELQKQALQLPISDRWQLVQILLESLQRETRGGQKKGNLSRLRGIVKTTEMSHEDSKTEQLMSDMELELQQLKKPRQSLWGICRDLGQAPSAEDIDLMRQEAWDNFPRENI